MSAIQQVLSSYGNGIVNPFTAWDVWSTSVPGNNASAVLDFGTSGAISKTNVDGDAGGTDGSANWYFPNLTGIGSSYWIRFTPTTGTFTTNGASTFTQLNAIRSVTKSATAGAASVTFTIEIAADSGGTVIVMTSAGNVLRYDHV